VLPQAQGITHPLPAAAGQGLGTQAAPRKLFTHWELFVQFWAGGVSSTGRAK